MKWNRLVQVFFMILIGGPVIIGASGRFKHAELTSHSILSTKIDRKALVTRHNIYVTWFDTLSSLTVGNGDFAFTVDATGLQTFPEHYLHGVSLGTESQWGWHSFPNPHHYTLKDILREYNYHGRKIPYAYASKSTPRQRAASNWLRANPQRIDLGRIGFDILNKEGAPVKMSEIKNIHQELNLWTGIITSHFTVEGEPVNVETVCHQQQDLLSVKIKSPLISEGRLKVKIRFPYASEKWGNASDWNSPDKHQTLLTKVDVHQDIIEHIMDATRYYAAIQWREKAHIHPEKNHEYLLTPAKNNSNLTFSCLFSQSKPKETNIPDFSETRENSISQWKIFWMSGGAIDFKGSTDPRAMELERRIVLSQYLTKIQDSGPFPPQETGLTYNSWYGKFHLEMHFWHEAQFALWNRIGLLEKSLDWYKKIEYRARKTAQMQGFKGVRWPKMTDPSGRESPSSVGPFLIWQEPHIIYFSELCYQHYHNRATLKKYKNLVFQTADFMASYAYRDKKTGKYILGPDLIPAQECFNPKTTINPPFELAYWYWGLSTAQKWRERLGLPRVAKWDSVLTNLSPLAKKDGVYLAAQSEPDSYTNQRYMTDHPAALMAYSFLPKTRMINVAVMKRTFNKVMNVWNWPTTWGWDYPMMAMTATHLGEPEKAIDILFKKTPKNVFLPDGHNYQRSNLRIYLPGNGSLLLATAMMCAGWDGYHGPKNPGFPKNGKWVVRWENLNKLP